MHFDSEQTFSIAEPDSHSESFKLKLTFTERNLQRIREENSRLSQKILRLQETNTKLMSQQKAFLDKIDKLEMSVNRERLQKEGLIKKLEVRTQRHQAEQNKNITKAEKQVLESRIKKAEANLTVLNDQKSIIIKKCESLAFQLQEQRKEKIHLREQIVCLQKHNLEDIDKIQQVEQLYRQKIALIEAQNTELKKQIDSLIIEVKLFERKKEIQGLLNYQNRIGLDSPPKKTKRQIYLGHISDKQNRISQCGCGMLEQQLQARQELIDLLKEKNSRLLSELESLKKRCVTLQNIVCRNDSCLK